MSKLLSGKDVSKKIKEDIKIEVNKLNESGVNPTLGIIRLGNRADDIAYEKGIIKSCQSVGIVSKVFELSENASMSELTSLLEKVNTDNDIHGILIFRPLPKQIDESIIKELINPDKDIDCMNPRNLERVFEGSVDGFVPCTPKAVMEILNYYEYPLVGANVAVVNSSMVVGKPLSMMLLSAKATVTICNSKTRNLSDITSRADIVVTAVGKAKLFGEEYFTPNSIVIDVGINDDGNGGICGDVDYEYVSEKVSAITPVPGGVGSVTNTILLKHVVEGCKRIAK